MITELNRKMLSNFYIKNHWNHLYHHLYHLFEIIYKSIFYNLNITLKKSFISKTINTRGNFIRKCPLGPCGLPEVCVWQFFIFTVIATIETTSCIFGLRCFNCSNSLVPLSFLLCHHTKQYNQMGIVMRLIATKAAIRVWLFICCKTKLEKNYFFKKKHLCFYKIYIFCRKKCFYMERKFYNEKFFNWKNLFTEKNYISFQKYIFTQKIFVL